MIKSKALLVISKTFCPHCKRTKQVSRENSNADYVWILEVFFHVNHYHHHHLKVFDSYNLNLDKFKWLDIDIRSDMDAIQSQMKQVPY